MDAIKKQLWEKLQDDISELNEGLQELLEKGANKGTIEEEDVISEIDDMDGNIKLLEKFYDLADKLGVKILTIEEALEKEQEATKKESKLWKVSLYGNTDTLVDSQYKDFIKLYFNDISKIPLLTYEEEKEIARRIKKGDEEAIETLTLEDFETQQMLYTRTQSEDVLSIVDTYFMPEGLENDKYSIMGDIVSVKKEKNCITEEEIYLLDIFSNDVYLSISINKKNLMGEPLVNRRFRGRVWLQGIIKLP